MTTLVNGSPPVKVIVDRRQLVLRGGRPGPRGPAGPTGASFEDYVTGLFPALGTWTINHNLGRTVTVTVYTPGSVKMHAEVILTSPNQAVVVFAQPTPGYARVI